MARLKRKHYYSIPATPLFVVIFLSLGLVITLIQLNIRQDLNSHAASGKGGGKTTGSASLVVTPNPVLAYSTYHISGCGYLIGFTIGLTMTAPGATAFTTADVDSTGCLSRDWNSNVPGSYSLSATQWPNGLNRKGVLMSTTSFIVQ